MTGTVEQRGRLLLARRIEVGRRAARDSLYWYVRYVYRLFPAPHQRLMISALGAVERGVIRRLVIVAPPGAAKSTYGSGAFPTWYLGRHPEHNIIGATTNDELAGSYQDTSAGVLSNYPLYREVFPTVRPDLRRGWSREGLYLQRRYDPANKDPSLLWAGAGSGIIGRRANGIILDDVVDQKVARSEALMAARRQWVNQTIRSRLKPGGWLIGIGTLWEEDDVISMLGQDAGAVVITLRALSETREQYAEVRIPDDCLWRPNAATPDLPFYAEDGSVVVG